MPKSLLTGPEHRGEFARETGFGRITKLEPKGRNTQVTIDAEHLREPVTGWADATDTALMGHIGPAHAEARRIAYVIDTHRKADVDDDKLISDLTPREKVRAVMSILAVDANGTPLTGAAPPATPTQPSTSTSPSVSHETRAPSPPPAEEERPPTATERLGIAPGSPCPRCGKPRGGTMVKNPDGPGLIHQDCPPANVTVDDLAAQAAHAAEQAAADAVPPVGAGTGPSAPQDAQEAPPAPDGPPPADDPSQPAARAPLAAPSAQPGRRPRQAEEKPWVAFDGAGRVNLGSYAYQAAVGAITLAGELVVAKARHDLEATGTPIPAPDPRTIKFLANRILEAADRAQASVRPDGRPNRMDNSHTRARGAVRLALDLYPVPWGADEETRAAWLDNVAAFATMVLELGRDVTLAGEEVDG